MRRLVARRSTGSDPTPSTRESPRRTRDVVSHGAHRAPHKAGDGSRRHVHEFQPGPASANGQALLHGLPSRPRPPSDRRESGSAAENSARLCADARAREEFPGFGKSCGPSAAARVPATEVRPPRVHVRAGSSSRRLQRQRSLESVWPRGLHGEPTLESSARWTEEGPAERAPTARGARGACEVRVTRSKSP